MDRIWLQLLQPTVPDKLHFFFFFSKVNRLSCSIRRTNLAEILSKIANMVLPKMAFTVLAQKNYGIKWLLPGLWNCGNVLTFFGASWGMSWRKKMPKVLWKYNIWPFLFRLMVYQVKYTISKIVAVLGRK